MGELTANAHASMPASKKATTQTMGKLGRMRLRPSKRDFFGADRTKGAATSKIGRAPDALCSDYRPGSKLSLRRSAAWEPTTAAIASSSASLRSVQTEIRNLRGGNDARRKAWKTQTLTFPPFPPRLEIRQKAPDSHIPTASTATISPYLKLSRAPPHLIDPLTDAGHFGQDPSASVASLRW
jgi:hypothetical protein